MTLTKWSNTEGWAACLKPASVRDVITNNGFVTSYKSNNIPIIWIPMAGWFVSSDRSSLCKQLFRIGATLHQEEANINHAPQVTQLFSEIYPIIWIISSDRKDIEKYSLNCSEVGCEIPDVLPNENQIMQELVVFWPTPNLVDKAGVIKLLEQCNGKSQARPT